MIKKKLLLSIIFFSLFCITSISAQTKKDRQSLIKILEKLESRFDSNFSFIDKDIRNIYIEPPADTLNLKNSIDYLRNNTSLVFTVIGSNYITITKNKDNLFSICGYLMDGTTNFPIESAVVQFKEASTITDSVGYFKLEDLSLNDMVTFRHISYEIFTDYAKNLKTKDCEVVFLESKIENLNEIILKDYITEGINKVIDGSISVNYKNFGTVPGLIETDVLQTIQAVPGIQSIDETVSNINVRGGTHDQNLILWDGIKLYQSGHFFGLISAVNPRITKKVKLYKNGTPTMYSDGISGTIDMESERRINKVLNAETGLNFINLDAFVDIPIHKKSSLQIASRTSVNEFLNTPTYTQYFDRAFQNTDVVTSTNNTNSTDEKFNFYDVSMRWLYKISEKDNIRANFLHLKNNLTISENAFGGGQSSSRESSIDQSNIAGGLEYKRRWNQKFQTTAQLYATSYQLDGTNFDIIKELVLNQKNKVVEVGVDLNSRLELNDYFTMFNGYHYKTTEITNADKINFPVLDTIVKETVQSHALSSTVAYRSEGGKTSINLGVRANYLTAFDKFIIEPRLNFNYRINDKITIEVLGELKSQTTTLVNDFRNNFLGIESRRWTLANNGSIPILKSKQISLGSNYSYNSLLVNAEVYYKSVDGITTQSQGFRNQYEFINTVGEYDVMGFDFMVNNRFGKFNTWLSYSLADNNYTFKELDNQNFPSNYDITHTVSIAGGYNFENFKLSAGANWRTGKPLTKPKVGNEISNNSINYESANSDNLASYFRVDASAIYDFNFSKRIRAQAAVSVLNVLDKKNIINTYYLIDEDTNEVDTINTYSLGITPNVAFRVFF
ncbi:TonB-dependent receptor plug domain-containing protein [Aureibaculum sp. 2210JD6-5]|uniref:TonB-dependent receptor n=1 Tax=Aureibaculum sp. 2210JD6-5 TaxID=3103957 RepID=UPI002AADEFDF|nr:TonB-dependent receptor plug domain-containing protein [Aureibaculum sp. 2210JD6-5]MDY7394877.1 TonB-dependent receptor plug domain-containing protein [Aureibaculum sp. 2210JD6-5]